MKKKFRLLALGIIALLPSWMKRLLYRLLFGYRIGKNVKLGICIIDAQSCEIQDDVEIGHLNLFIGTRELIIRDHARIGHLNVIRGGIKVDIGRYAEILRQNEINSIPNPVIVNVAEPSFLLGAGSIVTTSHKIDFTDKVEFVKCLFFGGRTSSLWTHNRQQTEPITIGDYSYLGSEIRIAPGGSIPARCIVGIGSVITKRHVQEYKLIAGVPAKVVKELDEGGRFLTEFKTRPDLPDDI